MTAQVAAGDPVDIMAGETAGLLQDHLAVELAVEELVTSVLAAPRFQTE